MSIYCYSDLLRTKTPNLNNSNEFADYIELVCLASNDAEVSVADILDFLNDNMRDLKTDVENIPNDRLTKRDNKTHIIKECFKYIEKRKDSFGVYYPFNISDGNSISINTEKLTNPEKLYIYLLFCSNLKYINRHDSPFFTSYFELLSKKAISYIVNNTFRIYLVGKGAASDPEFALGSKKEKFNKIMNLCCWKPGNGFDDIPEKDVGEGGIDILAIGPSFEKVSNNFVYIAQCACTAEWENKQLHISIDSLSRFFCINHSYIQIIIIPLMFRNLENDWYQKHRLAAGVLIDRLKLLKYLPCDDCYNCITSHDILKKYIREKISIF
ncbi:hypothetical protein [Seleniivibrio woodruffii]|uniref:hypothetical protein n=1 Tax=Seleniivibrio woodruffii TaxID=1078050 RepID=UPI00240A5307|nr:hypothetical protein [Seleniivibrio woodruffii]